METGYDPSMKLAKGSEKPSAIGRKICKPSKYAVETLELFFGDTNNLKFCVFILTSVERRPM